MAFIVVLRPIFTMFIILASFLENCSAESKSNNGFTTNLIRRDHPQKSDGSSSKSDHFDWLSRSFNRSISRADYFHHVISKQKSWLPTLMVIDPPLTRIEGDYVMEVDVGTPPVRIVAIADTGSDMTWTQCLPCINCFKQKDPLFDPNKTSTYMPLSCDSLPCKALRSTSCDESNKCRYKASYADGSQSRGDLVVDTFTFHSSDGKNVSFPNTTFGCGHNNSGEFSEMESGIIGLNRGALSIVNQFSSTISKKFSYCLAHIDKSPISKISFGVDAVPPGSEAVSTPLLKDQIDYYITLEGISVGNKRIDMFKSSGSQQDGNMIIDSGTTLNLLPHEMYIDLRSTVLDTIKARPVKHPNRTYDPCFPYEPNLEFPDLVFHFTDADVVIPSQNAFILVSEGLVCLMTVPARNDTAIFGNLSQMNFLIEYDLENEKLSFLPTDCTKE